MSSLLQTHNQVGIIGGTNGTGAQFAQLLSNLGFQVRVSGRKTTITNHQLAKESDILIFAPPLKESVIIIQETIDHCQNENQLILDLCSIKEPQVKAMQQGRGTVIGLHPLFGSHFTDVKDQDIIICPTNDHFTTPLTELLEQLGLVTHKMTPEQHDKLMATIQVIPHLSALISGSLFRHLNIHPETSLRICSPVYKTELYMIGRIYSQNPALYASIIGNNTNSEQIAKQLKEILDDLIPKLIYQDIDAIEGEFSKNKEHFGAFAQTALQQSQKLFHHLND